MRTRLLALGGLLAALATLAFPATAMAADTSTTTSSTTTTTAPPASTTTSTTTTTTQPAETTTTAGCPAGADAIENADTNASADSNTVTATFKVVAGCHDVQLSLASYRVHSSTNKPLSASVRGFFDAGNGKLVLHLPAECTYDVYLMVGAPPARAPSIDDDFVLAGGTRTSSVCHGGGGGGGTTNPPPTGQLPFTGTMALPMLLVGLGLVAGGITFLLLTRTRRTARGQREAQR